MLELAAGSGSVVGVTTAVELWATEDATTSEISSKRGTGSICVGSDVVGYSIAAKLWAFTMGS